MNTADYIDFVDTKEYIAGMVLHDMRYVIRFKADPAMHEYTCVMSLPISATMLCDWGNLENQEGLERLAVGILLSVSGDIELALQSKTQFAQDMLSKLLPDKPWMLSVREIFNWLNVVKGCIWPNYQRPHVQRH